MKITLGALRCAAGYTQDKAAMLLGISRATLHKWEEDSTKIPMDLLEKCANLYGWTANLIYTGPVECYRDNLRRANA